MTNFCYAIHKLINEHSLFLKPYSFVNLKQAPTKREIIKNKAYEHRDPEGVFGFFIILINNKALLNIVRTKSAQQSQKQMFGRLQLIMAASTGITIHNKTRDRQNNVRRRSTAIKQGRRNTVHLTYLDQQEILISQYQRNTRIRVEASHGKQLTVNVTTASHFYWCSICNPKQLFLIKDNIECCPYHCLGQCNGSTAF